MSKSPSLVTHLSSPHRQPNSAHLSCLEPQSLNFTGKHDTYALLEDPTAPPISAPSQGITSGLIENRTVHLRDRVTTATVYPIFSPMQVPLSLLAHLSDEFNQEIDRGDTYPMEEHLPLDKFRNYWFGMFSAIMLRGNEPTLREGRDWSVDCLGSFYV